MKLFLRYLGEGEVKYNPESFAVLDLQIDQGRKSCVPKSSLPKNVRQQNSSQDKPNVSARTDDMMVLIDNNFRPQCTSRATEQYGRAVLSSFSSREGLLGPWQDFSQTAPIVTKS